MDFLEYTDAAVTVCDLNYLIIYMNEKSIKTFEKYGGKQLIGKSLLDCHPEPAKSVLQNLMKTQGTNSYTIEKNGVKKIILQRPWYKDSEFMGLIEFSFEIPLQMNHFIRK